MGLVLMIQINWLLEFSVRTKYLLFETKYKQKVLGALFGTYDHHN